MHVILVLYCSVIQKAKQNRWQGLVLLTLRMEWHAWQSNWQGRNQVFKVGILMSLSEVLLPFSRKRIRKVYPVWRSLLPPPDPQLCEKFGVGGTDLPASPVVAPMQIGPYPFLRRTSLRAPDLAVVLCHIAALAECGPLLQMSTWRGLDVSVLVTTL